MVVVAGIREFAAVDPEYDRAFETSATAAAEAA